MTDWNATGNWKLGLRTGARWIKYGNELSLFCLLSRATALGINYLLAYYYSVEGSSGSVCFFIVALLCFSFPWLGSALPNDYLIDSSIDIPRGSCACLQVIFILMLATT